MMSFSNDCAIIWKCVQKNPRRRTFQHWWLAVNGSDFSFISPSNWLAGKKSKWKYHIGTATRQVQRRQNYIQLNKTKEKTPLEINGTSLSEPLWSNRCILTITTKASRATTKNTRRHLFQDNIMFGCVASMVSTVMACDYRHSIFTARYRHHSNLMTPPIYINQ